MAENKQNSGAGTGRLTAGFSANNTEKVWFENMRQESMQKVHRATLEQYGTAEEIENSGSVLLLSQIQHAEEWIAICFTLESSRKSKLLEEFWQAGLEKFQHNPLYMESLGFYFFRQKKHHKALACLKKAHEANPSPLAIKISIVAAYALAQYHLVWDFFNLLNAKERQELEDEVLSKVATAALQEKMYREAENLFVYIQKKNKLPVLPTLEKTVMDIFGNEKSMKEWSLEMENKANSEDLRRNTSISQWVTYASVLMYFDKYEQAVQILTKVKKDNGH